MQLDQDLREAPAEGSGPQAVRTMEVPGGKGQRLLLRAQEVRSATSQVPGAQRKPGSPNHRPPTLPAPPPRPALCTPSAVTSAAGSGCRSCSALSAGDCPAGAAPPSGTARPPPLCAGWLASCFVRSGILLWPRAVRELWEKKSEQQPPTLHPTLDRVQRVGFTSHSAVHTSSGRRSGGQMAMARGRAPLGLLSWL